MSKKWTYIILGTFLVALVLGAANFTSVKAQVAQCPAGTVRVGRVCVALAEPAEGPIPVCRWDSLWYWPGNYGWGIAKIWTNAGITLSEATLNFGDDGVFEVMGLNCDGRNCTGYTYDWGSPDADPYHYVGWLIVVDEDGSERYCTADVWWPADPWEGRVHSNVVESYGQGQRS